MGIKWNADNTLADPELKREYERSRLMALGEVPSDTSKDPADNPQDYQRLAGQTSDPMTNPQPVDALGEPVTEQAPIKSKAQDVPKPAPTSPEPSQD